MTARQRIGVWCLACLAVGTLLGTLLGIGLGISVVLVRQPHVCDSTIVNHYEHTEHPVCVRYEYQPPTETP